MHRDWHLIEVTCGLDGVSARRRDGWPIGLQEKQGWSMLNHRPRPIVALSFITELLPCVFRSARKVKVCRAPSMTPGFVSDLVDESAEM